jgi:hypothetical protein
MSKKMRELSALLQAFLEHSFALVGSGLGPASGVLGSHRGSLGCSGAGCTLLFDDLSFIQSRLAEFGTFLGILGASAAGNHGESQCYNKQNCHYSLHALSSLETE